MFEQIELLNADSHSNLRFTPQRDYKFASNIYMAPLSMNEIILASRFFPVVFSMKESHTPYALFSLEKGVNRFVTEDGLWNAGYIPLHIRRYPFILASIQDEKSYGVCIDVNAPHFSSESGEALFDIDGKPEFIVESAKKILGQYLRDMLKTEDVMKELDSMDLLQPRQLQVVRDGVKTALGNFCVINMKKTGGLDADILKRWINNGLMNVLYAHLHSLSHLNSYRV